MTTVLAQQYVNSWTTHDWTFQAFGGRWGIMESKWVPMEQLKTEIWLYSKVFETWTPMSVVIGIGCGAVAALVIGGILLAKLRKRLRTDGGNG